MKQILEPRVVYVPKSAKVIDMVDGRIKVIVDGEQHIYGPGSLVYSQDISIEDWRAHERGEG